MLEFWATLKVWSEYIIPATIIITVIIISLIVSSVRGYKWNQKIKWLKSHNFVRYLSDVPSVGNGSFYGWKNDKAGQRIDERNFRRMDYNNFLKKING